MHSRSMPSRPSEPLVNHPQAVRDNGPLAGNGDGRSVWRTADHPQALSADHFSTRVNKVVAASHIAPGCSPKIGTHAARIANSPESFIAVVKRLPPTALFPEWSLNVMSRFPWHNAPALGRGREFAASSVSKARTVWLARPASGAHASLTSVSNGSPSRRLRTTPKVLIASRRCHHLERRRMPLDEIPIAIVNASCRAAFPETDNPRGLPPGLLIRKT